MELRETELKVLELLKMPICQCTGCEVLSIEHQSSEHCTESPLYAQVFDTVQNCYIQVCEDCGDSVKYSDESYTVLENAKSQYVFKPIGD